jgi:hypothetical protein
MNNNNVLTKTVDDLIDVRNSLYAAINDTTKPRDVRLAALGEYDEVALRVRMLLARDLEQQVTELEKLALKIKEAHEEVKLAISGAKKAADIVKSVSTFLGFVDKLIDKAKLLLPIL